uniref:hypothetical protein n=1 Tax=uncultured Draconibacterium sp. TaxID=1573823 RepID=UPI003217E6F7
MKKTEDRSRKTEVRTILTFAFLLFTCSMFAQGDFKAENGAVIWQKVYNVGEAVSIGDLALQLADVNESGTRLTGNIKNSPVNYKAQGVSRMQMPLYMNNNFSAGVVIEQKENRYRVTVNNIAFADLDDYNSHTNEGQTALSTYVLKKGVELRKSQLKALEIFSKDLEQRFIINKETADW